MAQMPRASVDKFTWNPAVPCTAAPLVSAGAMPKRPVAFREAASSQGQSPSCEGRYGEPAWCRGTTLADECHGYEGHPPSGANVPLAANDDVEVPVPSGENDECVAMGTIPGTE